LLHIAEEGDQQDGRVRKLSCFLTEGGALDRVQLGPLTPTIIVQIYQVIDLLDLLYQ